MKKKEKAKFIVFEGGDGTGKSTQATKTDIFLFDRNRTSYLTREPFIPEIRQYLVENKGVLDPLTELHLFLADRRQHLIDIRQKISQGRIVICDRYFYSNMVFQKVDGLDQPQIFNMNMKLGLLFPDIVFFIDVDPEVAYERLKIRFEKEGKTDRCLSKGIKYTEKIILEYRKLWELNFNNDKTKVYTIDGNLEQEVVFKQIQYILEREVL